MAAAGLLRAWTLGVGAQVMLTVSISLAVIVVGAALIAWVIPLVLKRLRVDPAVVSAPRIATLVDG
ncbi:magnesium transporter, partial [Miniimonas arenae]